MNPNTLPPLYLSHGSPTIALEPGEAGRFMQRLGPAIDAAFGRPRAILAISAHSLTRVPVLLGAARHETIHDFGGFAPALFEMRYDAPGEPAVARRAEALMLAAGLEVHRLDEGGLDHGIWTVLHHVYPKVDVPVVALAWPPQSTPDSLMQLGRALAPLAHEGVLIMATGSITHDLRRVFTARGMADEHTPEAPDSAAFRAWWATHAAARDWPALAAYRGQAPGATRLHPTDEHLLPWFIAAGAGEGQAASGPSTMPQRLYAGATHGTIGMDAYAFGPQAARLAAALEDVEPAVAGL